MRSCNLRRPFGIAVFALLALSAPASALPMLTLDIAGNGPVCTDVCGIGPGDSVMLTVLAQEIPTGTDGKGLFGFGFEVTFAASGLLASNPAADSQWTGIGSTAIGLGHVGVTHSLFDPINGIADSGPFGSAIVLATFDVEALLPGTYTLRLKHFTATGDNQLFDGTMLDDDGHPGFFTTGSLRVVPEPSLVTLGLVAIGLFRASHRRR